MDELAQNVSKETLEGKVKVMFAQEIGLTKNANKWTPKVRTRTNMNTSVSAIIL